MVCLGNICINTLHKGAKDDDDDGDDTTTTTTTTNNNNNNNNKCTDPFVMVTPGLLSSRRTPQYAILFCLYILFGLSACRLIEASNAVILVTPNTVICATQTLSEHAQIYVKTV
jgi:hypothetical protein